MPGIGGCKRGVVVKVLAVWGLLLGPVVLLRGQENVSQAESKPAASKPAPALDNLPLPKDQIIVVVEDLKQALERSPVRWVLLSPEAYQKLLQQVQPSRPAENPAEVLLAECHYQGRVIFPQGAGSRPLLLLQMRLLFATTRSQQRVEVGLKGARLTRAELDGGPVSWTSNDGRLSAVVASPGRHELVLETPIAVSYDAGQRQYTAVLENAPPAAITTLDMVVPGKVRSASVKNGGMLRLEFGEWPDPSPAKSGGGKIAGTRLLSDAVGVLSRLELSWQPVESQLPGPAGTLTGNIVVTLREAVVETEARLTLSVRQGEVSQVRLRLPPGSSQIFWSEENRATWNSLSTDGQGTVTLQLPTPLSSSTPSWSWTLRWQQNLPQKGPVRLAIARLELIEPAEYQQFGTIELNNPENRPVSWNGNVQAIEANRFRYLAQPVQLELRLEEGSTLPPLVEVQAQYSVLVTPQALIVRGEWQLTRVQRLNWRELEFDWPEGFELDQRGLPSNLVVDQPQPRIVRVQLAGSQFLPHKITLEGWTPLASASPHPSGQVGGQSPASSAPFKGRKEFALPWLVRAYGEHYGRNVQAEVRVLEAKVQFPATQFLFQLTLGPQTRGLLGPGGRRLYAQLPLHPPAELPWDSHGAEERIVLDLAWQPHLAAAQWEGKLCVTRQRWQLEQVLRWQFSVTTPPVLNLQVPPELRELQRVRLRLAVPKAKTLTWQEVWVPLETVSQQGGEESSWRRLVLPPGTFTGCEMHFNHTAPLDMSERGDGTLPVPIVLPARDEAELQTLRLRCWHTADLMVTPVPGSLWQADQDRPSSARGDSTDELAPDLALMSLVADAPLVLQTRSVPPRPSLADRLLVLLQPAQDRSSRMSVQAKYWLTGLGSTTLTLQLPPDATLTQVLANREKITPSPESAEDGSSRFRLLIEPRFLSRGLLLEVHYRLSASRPDAGPTMAMIPWPVRCRLPESEPGIEPGVVRWALLLEPSWRPVYVATSALPEENWHWHFDSLAVWNWLQFPTSQRSRQSLESWLTSGRDTSPGENAPLYVWRQHGAIGEMQVAIAARHAWTLGCSLIAVLVGAVWLYGPRWLRLPALLVAAAALLLLAWWSSWCLVATFAGALPGILIVAVLILAIELQRWWWEKRLEWQAGFESAPLGSTVQQPPPASAAPVKPRSTVEAPAGQLPHPLPSSTGQPGGLPSRSPSPSN